LCVRNAQSLWFHAWTRAVLNGFVSVNFLELKSKFETKLKVDFGWSSRIVERFYQKRNYFIKTKIRFYIFMSAGYSFLNKFNIFWSSILRKFNFDNEICPYALSLFSKSQNAKDHHKIFENQNSCGQNFRIFV
jgi:hypothetical protein